MLPLYTLYETIEDINYLGIKKGEQIIQVFTADALFLFYNPTEGLLSFTTYQTLLDDGLLTLIGEKDSGLPPSQIHPDILKFYKSQLNISLLYTLADLKELNRLFGREYITSTLSTLTYTLVHMVEQLESTPILPTIVGKAWYDFVEILAELEQLAIIPAIIAKLSKVTLNELGSINSLEVSIEGFYKIHFDILSQIDHTIILSIRLIESN